MDDGNLSAREQSVSALPSRENNHGAIEPAAAARQSSSAASSTHESGVETVSEPPIAEPSRSASETTKIEEAKEDADAPGDRARGDERGDPAPIGDERKFAAFLVGAGRSEPGATKAIYAARIMWILESEADGCKVLPDVGRRCGGWCRKQFLKSATKVGGAFMAVLQGNVREPHSVQRIPSMDQDKDSYIVPGTPRARRR